MSIIQRRQLQSRPLYLRKPSEDVSSVSSYQSDLFSPCSTASSVSDVSNLAASDSATNDHAVEELPLRKPPVKLVLGTASIGSDRSPLAKISTPEDVDPILDLFRSRGYFEIDTARAYPVGAAGTCERLLGQRSLSQWAEVSTKVSSFMPGCHSAKSIMRSINYSLESLNVESVDIMYLHAPDRATPFKITCEVMHNAFLEGKFQRFGLSNFTVDEVIEVVTICEENGYTRPSVYQGQYNPVCRDAEDRLFTTLKQHRIAFYAYSPSACGFFGTEVASQKGRWTPTSPLGKKYISDYFHGHLFAVAEVMKESAAKYGITGHAAALRWTAWHSELSEECGDAVIIGFSAYDQLAQNLNTLEQGPLPAPLLNTINEVWGMVKLSGEGPQCALV
ncbi:hypothetical protein LTR70_009273 [Exophiala xenobiotica]|uniref:NADP-dependent oxidoreductase domain-containing protein n=1 Tax=Lithohypha guttulata TaxID=1690604 RepID=A0ABR0JYA7_9EURO|nr:hypothetical protein LTR24_009125 [Lithohypha guttulata]KAK5310706.1 hypothetical protein LTR70_009273 [Exophiala xenobiotica]